MDPASAIALLDALLTAADHVSNIVAEHQKTGAITVEEQQERLDKIEAIRAKLEN